ncbi:MAG: hypothetical protein CML04_11865 [Pseudozobellia sp.]|nr:hypothetical protein [Pseudozobellia sp.]MBG50568.1 hypothetical protein [Pseudozobellia sp.]|tara:strand:- start:1050 stop:1562 length:513 start_codon:yes stop_codon:yes gene_type:complete
MYANLETERLYIRPIELKDSSFLKVLVNSKGWLQFIGDRLVSNEKDAEQYLRNIREKANCYYHVFALKDDNVSIGVVTFLKRENHEFPDIGFAILPEFEGKGYALEASRSYLIKMQEAFIGENIIAITLSHNIKSINLLKKLGLKYQYDYKEKEEKLSLFSLRDMKRRDK